MTTRTERCAGILIHPTSLPGRFGVGDFGPDCERFLEWAAFAGFKIWQVLPLNPTGYGNSPYGALSPFAGNPLLISPERLVEDGILPEGVLETSPTSSPDRIDFGSAVRWKEEVLRTAWKYFLRHSFKLLEAF